MNQENYTKLFANKFVTKKGTNNLFTDFKDLKFIRPFELQLP